MKKPNWKRLNEREPFFARDVRPWHRYPTLASQNTSLPVQPKETTMSYHQLKKIVSDQNLQGNMLRLLLLDAARKGVIRDVELLWPIVVAYNCNDIMKEAFILCAKECHISILNLIMSNFAENAQAIESGFVAAVESGHPEVVEFFLKHGCSVRWNDDILLVNCCKAGDYPDVLKLLVDNGIDVFKHYHEAYDICLKNGYTESANFLVKYSAEHPPKLNEDSLSILEEECNPKTDEYSSSALDEEYSLSSDDSSS